MPSGPIKIDGTPPPLIPPEGENMPAGLPPAVLGDEFVEKPEPAVSGAPPAPIHHPLFSPGTEGPSPSSRVEIEKRLLGGDTAEAQGYRERAEIFPALTKWLSLGELSETVDVPVSLVQGRMKDKLNELLLSLRRITHLKYAENPQTAEKKMAELGKKLGLPDLLTSPQDDDWRTLSAADVDFLDSQEGLIQRIKQMTHDLASLPADGVIRYKISLWNREISEGPKLPPQLENDLGCQVLTVSLPDGTVVDGFVLRLLRNGEELILGLSEPVGGNSDHLFPVEVFRPHVMKFAKKIADEIGVESPIRDLPFAKVSWTQPPLVPVMAPHGAEKALERIGQQVAHPERALFAWPRGSYEALRSAARGRVDLQVPWWGPLPHELAAVWGFEIEPNPQPGDVEKYVWAFNAGTGRSIEVYLPDGHRTSDGTTWHHLSLIGIGKTSLTSSVSVDSDGLLKWDNALTRFTWTNYLHWAGSPLGFRTSLAVALFDRANPQGADDLQHGSHAVVAELRREQLRLWDLSPDLDLTGRILERVKRQVAEELGRQEITNEEYISWLADMLGTQFAILQYLRVDHGESLELPPKLPQLHAGQFTLMGELCDFEQATFGGKSETRYLRNDFRWSDHLDLERIHELQRKVLKAHTEGRSLRLDYKGTAGDRDLGAGGLWLAILLEIAPTVDFAGTVEKAYRKKLHDLGTSGIDPGAMRDRFHAEKWSLLAVEPLARRVAPCRSLGCMDEGIRGRAVGLGGSGILVAHHLGKQKGKTGWEAVLTGVDEVAHLLRGKIQEVTSHEACAAAQIVFDELSESGKAEFSNADDMENRFAILLAGKLGLPYRNITAEEMIRPLLHHNARTVFYTGTPYFLPDSFLSEGETAYVISRGILNGLENQQMARDMGLLHLKAVCHIALTQSLPGMEFTPENPFLIIPIGGDLADLATLRAEAETIAAQFGGRVKVLDQVDIESALRSPAKDPDDGFFTVQAMMLGSLGTLASAGQVNGRMVTLLAGAAVLGAVAKFAWPAFKNLTDRIRQRENFSAAKPGTVMGKPKVAHDLSRIGGGLRLHVETPVLLQGALELAEMEDENTRGRNLGQSSLQRPAVQAKTMAHSFSRLIRPLRSLAR